MIKIKIYNPVAGKNRISFMGFLMLKDALKDYSIEITESDDYDYAFLGAWNFIDYIRKNETEFKGQYITHVPEVHCV